MARPVTLPPEIFDVPPVTLRLSSVPPVTFSVAADVVAATVPPVMLAVPARTSSAFRVPLELIRPVPETFDVPETDPLARIVAEPADTASVP